MRLLLVQWLQNRRRRPCFTRCRAVCGRSKILHRSALIAKGRRNHFGRRIESIESELLGYYFPSSKTDELQFSCGFVGLLSLSLQNGNIAEALLKEGFARCVDWSMAVVTAGAEKYRAAEK